MSIADFLRELALGGWRFWTDGGRLKYRAPREDVSQSLLDYLKQHKPEIIQLLGNDPDQFDVCPLSYGQRALWFLWNLSPRSSAYNLSMPLRIKGGADKEAWLEACRLLLKQHPMLRTVFPSSNGEPIQKVRSQVEPCWAEADASEWSEPRLFSEIEAAHEEPFDLSRGPVARFRWFKRSDEEQILLITMHHIVSDGWSVEIIRRQLPLLYEMARGGCDLDPGTPEYTYHDYVRWQLEMLASPAGEALSRFWEGQLAGPLPILDIPTDRPRPAVKTYSGAAHHFALSQELSSKLRALAKSEGVTLYVAALASFLVLLHRYTGQSDIVIGSPNSGRSRPEFAPIVGYFVDPVAIRSSFPPRQTFKEFLDQTRRGVSRALEHSDFPFSLLVERLRIERDPSRSPVFDATFNYVPRPASNEPGGVEVFDITQADGKFDLTLNLTDAGAAMAGAFGYNSDLFREETIARLSKYFIAIVESVTEDPHQKLESIRLEREHGEVCRPVLVGPRLELREDHLVHRLFEAQADLRPNDVAVQAEDAALSYAELNQRANALAARLRQLGVRRESVVGVYTSRSAAFIVAILAIHKARGAYAPLDPGYPDHLLRHMIVQAGIEIILTESSLREPASRLGASAVCLTEFFAGPDSRRETNLDAGVELNNLAYVIYTSGSTGMSKGVAIEHRSLAGYVQSMLMDLRITERSNFALASTFSADLGNTVIFPSLCSGGCLHILPDRVRADGALFADYIQSHRIDYLKIVPSHLSALTASRDVPLALPRKALVLGGEGSSSRWVKCLQSSAPHCLIVNHYGPTEATVGVLTYAADRDDSPPPSETLPLRRPTANTEVYLLDQNMRSVPSGMIGELYIGGDCLARGYINAPGLTGEYFVPHDKSRVYKTGDLARQLPGGDIEILGRRDRQVKIRGYRVELTQVEAALSLDPLVRQCAVLPNENGRLAEHLLAFVVPATDTDTVAIESIKRELRRNLEQILPGHMVPAHFTILKELPLTPNGKLDAGALRRLAADPAKADEPALPRDLVEMELSRIWSEVLGLPRIGIADDFFQLGGHSLMAVRLAGRIHERFKRSVSLATLLTSPTIEKLAEVMRSSDRAQDNPVLVPIQPGASRPPLFFLPGAGGNVLYFYALSRHIGADQPCLGLQALGLDENSVIPTRIEDIASRYVEIIRRERQPDGPYYFVGHSFGAFVAFEMARQLTERGEEIALLCVIDNVAPAVSGDSYSGWGDREWLKHIAIRIGKLYRADLLLDGGGFVNKSYEQQIEYIIDRLISARLLPAGLNKTHFGRFIEIYKANAIAAVRYLPRPLPAPIPITLFKAEEEDSELNREVASRDELMGWGGYTEGPVRAITVPGTHLTMFTEPNVETLADRLRECVEQSQRQARQLSS